LVELVGGAGASDSPKVAAAMVTGGGRSGQAMAAAIQIASQRARERERGEWGWAGSVWPTQTRASWFSRARWAGWASRPVGPAGQMGQIGFGQLIQKQNFKFKFKGYFLLEFKLNSKIQITLIKHFLIL
jgi:hypothetical protein